MTTPRVCLSSLLLAVVVSACGDEEKPPALPPPMLNVALAGPEAVHCRAAPVVLSATITGGTPENVELLEDGATVAQLLPPYEHSFDCAARPERPYVFTVRANLHGRSFASAPKQIVVDRTQPSVTGPFPPLETEIAKDAPVRVTFSEPMRTSQVVPASVSVAGGTVKGLSWSADQKVLTVELQPIMAPQSLTLLLRTMDFVDLAGNPLPSEAITQWSWEVPGFLTTWTLPRYGDGLAFLDSPAWARDRSGRNVIAWAEYTSSSGATDVYVHRSGDSGNTKLGGPLSALPGSTSWIDEVKVAVDASNRPVLAWIERDTDEHKVFVRRWSGTSWEELGGVPNPVASAHATDLALATGSSDLPVVAWGEMAPGPRAHVYVYRWNGSGWDAVGNPIEARAGTGHALFPSLVLDGEGQPVLSVSEQSAGGEFTSEALVLRWNGTAWEQIGSALRPASVSAEAYVNRTSLSLDPQGKPALAFELFTLGSSARYDVYFARYGDSGWSSPQPLDGPQALRPSLGFDAEGAPWIAWENGLSGADSRVQMRKAEEGSRLATLEAAARPVFAAGGVEAPSLLVSDHQAGVPRLVRRQ